MNMLERMNAGLLYQMDNTTLPHLKACRRIIQKLNTVDCSDFEAIAAITKELLGKSENAFINPPFYCDYGKNIEAGRNLYVNFNCTILDVAKVSIGDNCLIAPNTAIYTAGHPLHPAVRSTGYQYGKPVIIGDNVWIGGSCVICPGVTIGSNVVIGAGSIVTKDIPDNAIAAGCPCRVIRLVSDDDKRKLFREELIDDEAWEDILKKTAM